MNKSKLLGNEDISSNQLNSYIFSDFTIKEVIFDRIQLNRQDREIVFVDYIEIEEPISNVSNEIKEKTKNLYDFVHHIRNNSGYKGKNIIKNFRTEIVLFFSNESPYKNMIYKISSTDNTFPIEKMSISEFSFFFRTLNNKGFSANPNTLKDCLSDNTLAERRLTLGNGSFNLLKTCLNRDTTSGINFDKVLYNPVKKNYDIYEYLLCDASQFVTPHSSHPNKYYNKNSSKFKSLDIFRKVLKMDFIFLNYAMEHTKHQHKFKIMQFKEVCSENKNYPVVTEDTNIFSPEDLKNLFSLYDISHKNKPNSFKKNKP